MDMRELYQTITSRDTIDYQSIKPDMRIAIVTPDGHLDVMKVETIGDGRSSIDDNMGHIAVAKTCPGQASVKYFSDGSVSLNELMDIHRPEDAYMSDVNPFSGLGVLSHRVSKAHWAPIGEGSEIYKIDKSEMRQIQNTL